MRKKKSKKDNKLYSSNLKFNKTYKIWILILNRAEIEATQIIRRNPNYKKASINQLIIMINNSHIQKRKISKISVPNQKKRRKEPKRNSKILLQRKKSCTIQKKEN